MRAIVYDTYGPPDVLQLADRPVPTPKAGEVLIRVVAVEATKSDCELRSFEFPVKWFIVPLRLAMGVRKPKREVLGSYFSGVVDAVGPGENRFAPGDAVFGAARMRFGGYAEYLTVPAHYTLVKKPDNVSFEEAAAVPLGGLNALHFLRRLALIQGESILINGAGGSIGSFAVQIAKSIGARVTAVDAPHKESALRQMGVDEFVDYTRVDFSERPERYDVVFDMVVQSSYEKCLSVLKKGGRYATANPTFSRMLRAPLTTVFTDKRSIFAFAGETQEELETLAGMLERGEIRAPVDRVFTLEDVRDAHRRVENEERSGVVVLKVC